MSKHYIITVLLTAVLPAAAQKMFLDPQKAAVFTTAETGAPTASTSPWVMWLHPDWPAEAAAVNKTLPRGAVAISTAKQPEKLDSIASDLTKRAEVEALNIIDRQATTADLTVWSVERARIERSLLRLGKAIADIVPSGGTNEEAGIWKETYAAYEGAIASLRRGYMPSSARKKQLVAICGDINHSGDALRARLMELKYEKMVKELANREKLCRLGSRKGAIDAAFVRWREAAATLTPSANK